MKRLIIFLFIMSFVTVPETLHATCRIPMGEFMLTAYCPCEECSEGYGRHTSTGKIARAEHTIAVDPDVIGYGAKVEIDGDLYRAEDCGGAVHGDHIDIFFDTHAEVDDYEVQYDDVWIIR